MINIPRKEPFNGPIESGLRTLVILAYGYPNCFSLEQLIALDYLLVHSDDIPDGPNGLHPKTPQRSGEILIRRKTLHFGIDLFMRKCLIGQVHCKEGLKYIANESSVCFLDSLQSKHTADLRTVAAWVITRFGEMNENELSSFIQSHMNEWGAEFAMESVLWQEDVI